MDEHDEENEHANAPDGAQGGGDHVVNIDVNQISNAIADRMASARQHNIPIFRGAKNECPIKFIRNFERVARALRWSDASKREKFPNFLADAGEEFHYVQVECLPNADQPHSWNELKELFLNHFMRGDYRSHLTKELRARK